VIGVASGDAVTPPSAQQVSQLVDADEIPQLGPADPLLLAVVSVTFWTIVPHM
jgi:hypothetical protein